MEEPITKNPKESSITEHLKENRMTKTPQEVQDPE